MRGIRLLAGELWGNQQNPPSWLQVSHIGHEQFSTLVNAGVFQDMRKQDRVEEPGVDTKKLIGRIRLEPTRAADFN